MSRILLQYLLPLVLPAAVWLVWWSTVGRKRAELEGRIAQIEQGPWFWLIIAGVLLLAASLIYTALTRGYDPAGTFVAPHMIDGRVVPGRVE